MQLVSTAASFLAILVLYYVITAFRSWRRLREFKGPTLASFSYLWMVRTTFSGRMWEKYRDVSGKYGSVARIGPNELITDDPEILRRTAGVRSQYSRSTWYAMNRLDPYEDTMFSLLDTAAHDKLKAKTASAYSGKENPDLEVEIDVVLAMMIDKIKMKYISTPGTLIPLDLAKMAQNFTLDSIAKVAFGEEFGFISTEEDLYGYLQTIEDIAPFMLVSCEIPYLASIMSSPFVLKLAGPKYEDKAGIGVLMRYAIIEVLISRLRGTILILYCRVTRDIVAKRFKPDAPESRDMLVRGQNYIN
jgi:hypothetical protein